MATIPIGGGFQGSGYIDPVTGEWVSTPGTTLNSSAGGPEIIPPANSTIPPGKQVGSWTNPFTHSSGIPLDSVGGAGGGNILSWLANANINPVARAAIAAAGVIAPTPADTGVRQRWAPIDPYGPTRTNAPIDPYGPTPTTAPPRISAPIDPYGPTRANAPIDPYGPTKIPPRAVAGPLADPAKVMPPSPGEYAATTGNARSASFTPGGFASPPASHFYTPLTPMYGS